MKRVISVIMVLFLSILVTAGCVPVVEEQPITRIRWGTSAVGSTGHLAQTHLATLLNREWEGYSVTVLPTPGAIFTVKEFCKGELDGCYGADIAFYEFYHKKDRFAGFSGEVVREPVQTFWAYTMETGLGIAAKDHYLHDPPGPFSEWRDLKGLPVFTGPLPWDVRANLERSMAILDVGHTYVEVDLGMVAPALDAGTIRGWIAYTAGETAIAPWQVELEMATDIQILNPSEEERAMLAAAGMPPVAVSPTVYATELYEDVIYFVPFYYGFHLGLDIPAEDIVRMLDIIEEFSGELAKVDPSYAMLHADMVEMQVRGVTAAIDYVKVHPGLAAWLKARDAWNPAWDDKIAR